MTIKRRIFISHILIICIPFVLCVFFSFGIRLVTMKIYSGGTGQVYDNEIFYEARRELLNVGSRFSENTDVPDSGALKSAAEDLQKRFLKYNIFFAVYDNGQWLMPPPRKTEPLFDAALLEEGNRIVSFDTTAVYIQSIGDAKIVAVCYDFHFNDDMHITSVMVAAILSFWIMILLILATNFILTRTMIKNISVPLDMLSFGVKQIQHNNLSFRLEYKNNDEFLPICDAFNVMAARLEAMAAEQDKYEENRRELLAGISHDLRTPLTSIKAYLEGIEKEVASTREKREKYIATIRNKTENIEHIINQLFLFSKLDINDFPLSLKILDIGQFMQDAAAELSGYYLKKGLVIALSETTHNIFARIDPVLFHNVITNILENSAAYKDAEQGRIEISVRSANAMTEIRLTDDGPGVPPESLNKLFDVFYRADPSRNTKGGALGNGLGLAISQKIVSRMDGSIKAEMNAECGLAIVIHLPQVPEEPVPKHARIGEPVQEKQHENFDY